MKRVVAVLALLFAMAGCETGHVIEITMTATQAGARSARTKIITDCLHSVAQDLGMLVEGPIKGPGEDVEFVAKYPTTGATSGFFISAQISNGVSIVFRSLSNQVDPALAERAFSLFRAELDRRGLIYNVRRS